MVLCILEWNPAIVPYSVIMDTTQRTVWSTHSSSPSVKSRLQHLNLFPDYIFVTLSTPLPSQSSVSPPPPLHPPPFPSLASKFSTFFPTSSISHYSNSSSVTFGLSHPISPLKISASFLLPQLPLFLPLLFLPAQFCLRLFTSIVPPDGLC